MWFMSSVFSLVIDADDTASKMISRLGASQGTLYELPTCPVSLEPMDSAIACLLITVPCSHLILCLCLSSWGDNRFVIYSESMVNKMCLTFWSILSVCSNLKILEEISKADEGADKATEWQGNWRKRWGKNRRYATWAHCWRNLQSWSRRQSSPARQGTGTGDQVRVVMFFLEAETEIEQGVWIESEFAGGSVFDLKLQSPINGNCVKIDKAWSLKSLPWTLTNSVLQKDHHHSAGGLLHRPHYSETWNAR